MKYKKSIWIDISIMAVLFVMSLTVICLPAEPYIHTDENGLFLSSSADSYHYARQALIIAESGKMNPFDAGQKNLLPWVAATVIRITGADAHAVISHISAFFLSLSVIPAYLFVKKRSTRIGGSVSGLCVALSPFLASHSQPGHFDTDALLALLSLSAVLSALEASEADTKRKRILFGSLSAGFLILLFFTWARWYIYAILVVLILIFSLFFSPSVPKRVKILLAFVLLLFGILAFPKIKELVANLCHYLIPEYNGNSSYPNSFARVSELQQLPFHKLVIRGGGLWYFFCVFFGMVFLILERKNTGLLCAFLLPVWFACAAFLSAFAVRFLALSALPAGLLAGFFAGLAPDILEKIFDLPKDPISKTALTYFSMLLGFTVLFNPIRYSYHEIKESSATCFVTQDMSDACVFLKEKTSKDSVLVSWWDYGYYYLYASNRTPLTNGGYHSGYLDQIIAKGLLEPDSEKAKGFFCEALGTKTDKNRYLILSEDMLKKTEAIQYFAYWDASKTESLGISWKKTLMVRLFLENTDSQNVFKLVFKNDFVKIYSF